MPKGDAVQVLSQTSFVGGISFNSKTAIPNSARFMQNLDIFRDKDSVTLAPGAVKESGATVTDLVLWGVSGQPWDTNCYFYGNTGNLYKRTSGAAWSVDRTVGVGAAAGQGLAVFLDGLYYATSTTIGRKYLLDNSPAYNDDFISDGTNNLDATTSSNTGNTYTTPVAISETATNKFTFTSGTVYALTKDPIKEIDVKLAAKGTGNWTLTVHDASNNLIGSATVSNASLVGAGNFQPFTFATPLRINLGATYHFHLTSSVADGTVTTTTASDLSTVAMNEYFGILVGSAPYHPMMVYNQSVTPSLIIGNSNYLASYNASGYNPNKIALESGFVVRALGMDQGYLVALADRGTDTKSFQEGRLYYWDGISPAYLYSIPVTIGVPNAGQSFKGNFYMIAGDRGDLYLSPTSSNETRRIQNLPKLSYGKTIEVAPGAMDVWQNIMRIGYGVNGDDTGFYAGVWDFGTQTDRSIDWQQASVDVLNLSTTISTGNTDSSKVQIGSILALGQQMFVSWKDTTSGTVYGVDVVTKGANPAASGTFESLIEDRGVDTTGQMAHMPQRNKHIRSLIVTFQSLPAGCSVTAKYKLDRAANWTTGTTTSTTGENHIITPVNNDAHEFESGYTLTSSGASAPVVTGIYVTYDLLESESLETFS